MPAIPSQIQRRILDSILDDMRDGKRMLRISGGIGWVLVDAEGRHEHPHYTTTDSMISKGLVVVVEGEPENVTWGRFLAFKTDGEATVA